MRFPSRKPCEAAGRRRALYWLAGLPLALAACGRDARRSPAGQALPDLEFPDFAGQAHRLREYAGGPLLINVWATWCPPCRGEMAGLERLYRELRPAGLAIVGICADSDLNLAREYLRQADLSFPIRSDPGGRAMAALLGTPAIPATLLVSRDGVIRRIEIGEREWDRGEARGWARELLQPGA